MKELWELFIVFAKIGGFTFGRLCDAADSAA